MYRVIATHAVAFVLGLVTPFAVVISASTWDDTSSANKVPSAVFTGKGLRAGANMWADIDGKVCLATQADGNGNWSITIPVDAPCRPYDGAEVKFRVQQNSFNAFPYTSNPAARWYRDGRPPSPGGYTLTPP